MLAASGGKDTAHLADQGIPCPQAAGLVQEVLELGSHVSESGRRAQDDAIVVRKLIDGCYWSILRELVACLSGNGIRHQLRHTFQYGLGTTAVYPFGNRLGHGFNMAVGRVIK